MEAHNGISAKIAEASGFKALWASGLTISASMGLRDSNEISWSHVLNILEYISEAVSIPVIVDGDSGHGNFNNVRIFVKKLCRLNLAGVCIEDKKFPKTNSFVERNQELVSIDEFVGKIKAAKDSQLDPNFTVIARTESFIAGVGAEEALKRAEAYYLAGADAIFIHSKKETPDEIFEFSKRWQYPCPLMIAPTKYYKTPTWQFEANGISGVIWANHSLRASIRAMQEICNKIQRQKSIANIEEEIAALDTIFDLVDDDELRRAEELYLPNYSISDDYSQICI